MGSDFKIDASYISPNAGTLLCLAEPIKHTKFVMACFAPQVSIANSIEHATRLLHGCFSRWFCVHQVPGFEAV